ncbi:beta-ketoacyl synthase chain length factor [Salinicola halimionae]|uniref:beta-ketoacyl synthase chain length factor n=1 Tax=Salinicola halimionae TaxID=1949081 RepID=UPI000DA19B64|nr:beta-ketoacyl synthase chain length factor [Salinicola halimionae]
MADLYLHDWRGWTPHRVADGEPRLDTRDKPAGTAVPSMLRRRLNLVGRAVCDMLAAIDPDADSLVLHASRHGDGERTLEMLYGLDEGEPLSPARFGLSVHNATVGVYSIASGNRRSQQAIAASGGEWAALIAESRGYLADHHSSLVVIFSDQPVPPRFAAYAPESFSAAVALRLGREPVEGARRLTETPMAVDDPTLQPLDIIDWLMGLRQRVACPMSRRGWQLANLPS